MTFHGKDVIKCFSQNILEMLLEINADGSIVEKRTKTFRPSKKKVYLLFDAGTETIYIWQGENASVQEGFRGLKYAKEFKKSLGYDVVKVQNLDDDSEYKESLKLHLKNIKAGKKLPKKHADLLKKGIPEEEEEEEIEEDKRRLPPLKEILQLLKKEKAPEGMVRDYLVAKGSVYTIDGEDVLPLEVPENGIFDATNYAPRVLLKDSEILAIEMWRRP